MKAADFRRLALGMKDSLEGSHMNHPDFRVSGRLFASLRQDSTWGMVALSPEQQQEFVHDAPQTFVPETGAWGRIGYTKVQLALVDEETLGRALTFARQNAINKSSKKGTEKKPAGKKVTR
jgi:hypothetical protein